MVVARSNGEPFSYVLVAERELPAEKQTNFQLRRLSTRQLLLLQNMQGEDAAGISGVQTGSISVAVLQIGLLGWSNFVDEHGSPVEFKQIKGERLIAGIPATNPASLGSLDLLPTEAAAELVGAIIKGNQITPEDRKN
jgi:hypothetical protein